MDADEQPSGESAARELVEAGGGRMPQEPGGSVRTALANAMVGMKKQFYGRGPTAAKAWILGIAHHLPGFRPFGLEPT